MRIRTLTAGLAAAITLVIAGAGPAAAHATLERTDPGDGSVVAVAPAQIAAQFDEPVGVSPDSLRVFSPAGDRVDDGASAHGADDSVVTTSLRAGLRQGTYTVAWHVVSADSHPVSGAFTFSIVKPSRTSVNPLNVVTRAGAAEGALFGVARWAGYLAFALLAGTLVFLALCWPGGADARGTRRLLGYAWGALAAASVGQLLLQGVYAGGLPIGRAVDVSVIRTTAASRFGVTLEIRLLLLALAAPALTVALPRLAALPLNRRLRAAGAALVFTLALAATWAATGHASNGIQVPLSFASDVLHLTAMAVWLGGLATLAFVVLPRPDDVKRAANAVTRFSTVAFTCVCVLVVTGAYQAWRDVGSFSALTGSAYGRLVLFKILGLLGLIVLGRYARTWIADALARPAKTSAGGLLDPAAVEAQTPARSRSLAATGSGSSAVRQRVNSGPAMRKPGRRTSRVGARPALANPADGTTATLRRLRWSVSAETAIGMGVLALTAALVVSPPGRNASGLSSQPGSTDVSLPFNTGTVSGVVLILVEPGRLGPNQSHLLIEDSRGEPYNAAQVSVSYYLPSRKIGPIVSVVDNDGPGHYVDDPVTLAFTGRWQVSVTIRSDQFDETTLRVPVTVTP